MRSFLVERTRPKKKSEGTLIPRVRVEEHVLSNDAAASKLIPRVRVEEHVLSNDAATPKLPRKKKSSTLLRGEGESSESPTGVADWQTFSANSTTEASELRSPNSSFLTDVEINDHGCCSVGAVFDGIATFNLMNVVDRIDDAINGSLEDEDEHSSDESSADSIYEDDREEFERMCRRPRCAITSSSNTRKYSSIGGRVGRASLGHKLRGLQRSKSERKRKDDGRERSRRRSRSVPRRGRDVGPRRDYQVRFTPSTIPVEGSEANDSFDKVLRLP